MEFSKTSIGMDQINFDSFIKKHHHSNKVIALGGNPNVGKSTVFNQLTGLNQHTGNWPGKTVSNAQGYCFVGDEEYILVDLPGCYSLMSHSTEEEIARNFICFGEANAIVIVCDATCLERNLNLVLQTIEMTKNVIVCINLMDEAKKKKISIDMDKLSKKLGVPVIGTSARSKKGLDVLMQSVCQVVEKPKEQSPIIIEYPDYIEESISILEPLIKEHMDHSINPRWISLMLLYQEDSMGEFISQNLLSDSVGNNEIKWMLQEVKKNLKDRGITTDELKDDVATSLVSTAESLCRDTVSFEDSNFKNKDLKIDRILTGKRTAYPIMILALMGVFWLTITGANYPSQLLSNFLFWIESLLLHFAIKIGIPKIIYEVLILGIYRVLAWVVAVMLPPMAIFFPLFTLLEDVGFLPRIAFNLDKCFKKCSACGKQALTMCMVNLNL